MNSILEAIVDATGTNPNDWEVLDGLTTGVGFELWYVNIHNGMEVYGCNDQGGVSLSFN